MKERYEKTELEVIMFTADDVLRTSDPYELPTV